MGLGPLFGHVAVLFTGGVEIMWLVIQCKTTTVIPPVENHRFASCECGVGVFLERKWERLTLAIIIVIIFVALFYL